MKLILLLDFVFVLYLLEVRSLASTLSAPIDLSHALQEETPNWEENFKFRLIDRLNVTRDDGSFYAINNFIAAEHGGTHLDAPYHFNSIGLKVDELPLNRLLGHGILIDVSGQVTNDNFELLPTHLNEWVKHHGPVPKNTIALIKFGWSSRYPNRLRYFGAQRYPYSFPGISAEAARWIVNSTNIFGVGVDTPSTDPGNSTAFDTHKILSAANLFGLENVALDKVNLPARGFDLIVLPLKIKGGTGSPCRIVAI